MIIFYCGLRVSVCSFEEYQLTSLFRCSNNLTLQVVRYLAAARFVKFWKYQIYVILGTLLSLCSISCVASRIICGRRTQEWIDFEFLIHGRRLEVQNQKLVSFIYQNTKTSSILVHH